MNKMHLEKFLKKKDSNLCTSASEANALRTNQRTKPVRTKKLLKAVIIIMCVEIGTKKN